MESSSQLHPAANSQLPLASSSRSTFHRSESERGVSHLSAIKLRSIVAWVRLESRDRGCAGDGVNPRLGLLDLLALKFECVGERIPRVQEAYVLRSGVPDGRAGGRNGGLRAGNEVGRTRAGQSILLKTLRVHHHNIRASRQGEAAASLVEDEAKEVLHLAISLGAFIALDKYLKNVFSANGIRFPSALFGMFSLFVLLSTISAINTDAANKVESFFSPANLFIQRWLPLFYVASLVVVPLAVKGIPAAQGAKIGAILFGGWMCTLLVAGYTAMQVRKMVNTELLPADPVPMAAPFTSRERFSWIALMLLTFGMAVRYPTALGPVATTAAPFLLAATVIGYLLGTSLPAAVKNVFHPIVTCTLSGDLGAFALGIATGKGFEATLGDYMTKSAGSPGAGDVLNGFLGSVILSFAFSMYRQRKVVLRHAAEIFTAVLVSSLFSLYSTAAIGRFLGLLPSLTCAIIPHCVTVALALPIASLLEGTNPSLTAATVVCTGLIGANFAQVVMNKFGFKDSIVRGIATASSAHGLGTAALAGKEPEALPYCAIAYALTGIFSTVLCAIPLVRTSLIMIAGAA